ncbi:hypothetical protein [Mycolicibacterium iranicum]|uniref:hypothetical protein n=1 Tax=Mycolicibacterium iranicum TaxID=912594 RepID=UPI001F271F33|nr:hypothetical protein [Mycolicibacterium iranicum]
MVVHREVGQPLLCAGVDRIGNEARGELPVTAGSLDVVDTVHGNHHIANQQSGAARASRYTASQHGAVLVTVTTK